MNANEGTTPDMGWEAQIDAVAIKTDLDEIKSWINDGKLMPAHKVRMKNLTWIEAGKVPAFQKLFEHFLGLAYIMGGIISCSADLNYQLYSLIILSG